MRTHEIYISIDMVTAAHNNRKNLREKWKKKKHPLHYSQYSFLIKIHKNLYINLDGGSYYNWLAIDDLLKNNLNEMGNCNYYYILYKYFLDKFTKNKELSFRMQLTYLRKFIVINCDNIDLCRTYTDVLKCLRTSLQTN
jgi:hypothetical protein